MPLNKNFILLILMICPILGAFSAENKMYSKLELEAIALLPEDKKIKFESVLNLMGTNCTTNDSVLILKEPIYLDGKFEEPLFGMEFVIKGNIGVVGLTPLIGLKDYPNPNFIYEKNYVIVDKLLEAGIKIIGQGKGPPFNSRTISNPVNEPAIASRINSKYSSGGSSGGTASNNFYGLGTDIGGSGRIPAAYNKRCTLYGVFSSPERVAFGLSYTPFTDTVDDLWKIYKVLENVLVSEKSSLESPKRKNIAFVEKLPTTSDSVVVHSSRIKSLQVAMEALKQKGHNVTVIDSMDLNAYSNENNESKRIVKNFVKFFCMEIAKGLNKMAANHELPKRDQFDSMSWLLYNLGLLLLKDEQSIRQEILEDYKIIRVNTQRFKQEREFDLIITPTILAEWAKPDDFPFPEEKQTTVQEFLDKEDVEGLLEIATELYQREFNLCNTLWGNVHDGDLPIVVVPGACDEWGMYHSYQLIGLNGKSKEEIFELLSLSRQLFEVFGDKAH
ncbi:MAG: amidase family protein [Chlamydiales bacterium]